MKAAPLLFLSLCACGGGASVEGNIGGRSFSLSTLFGWVDATESQDDPQTGKVIFTARPSKDLHLVFSGASYDPTADVRFMSAADLLDISLGEVQNGAIGIEVSDFDLVANGMQLVDPREGNNEGPRLDASHRFAAVELEGDATYPSEAVRFGSRNGYKLTFDEVEREVGQTISGTLVVSVERADNDPAGVLTGAVTVTFSAELIGERIAECNRSEGRSDSCELVRL